MGKIADERWMAHSAVHSAEGKALDTAFIELQRRLTVLNHAHEQMIERDKDYVREDVWRGAHERLEEQLTLLALDITAMKARGGGSEQERDSNRAVWAIGIAAVSAFASVAAVLIVALVH